MVSKNIIAILAIVALVGTIGLSPAFADWDKTKYPSIEGTIPVENNQRLFKSSSNYIGRCNDHC